VDHVETFLPAVRQVVRADLQDAPVCIEVEAAGATCDRPWPSPPTPNFAAAISARLTGADLTAAMLTGANLADTDLTRADLTRTDLTRAELTGALWPQGWPVPAGWTRHSGSGQLISADADAEKTAAHQPHG
jgi:hypothetical protein